MLSVFIFGQPFEGLSYPFLDFGQPFKFFAIRLSGYGIRLNARVNRLLSVYNRFSRPFNGKALVSVFPWRVTFLSVEGIKCFFVERPFNWFKVIFASLSS